MSGVIWFLPKNTTGPVAIAAAAGACIARLIMQQCGNPGGRNCCCKSKPAMQRIRKENNRFF